MLFEVRKRLLELEKLLEGVDELALGLKVLPLLESLDYTHLELYALEDILCALLINSEFVDVTELCASPFDRLLQVSHLGHQSRLLYILSGW